MKFLNQSRLAQPWLTDDQHELPFTVPRALPAPHQHRDFFLTADERREMALACPTSATARTHQSEQRYRLRHTFQLMAAKILGDEQAGDLALNPCSDPNSPRLCQGLHTGRSVRRIAVNLTRRIDYHRAGFDADPGVERRLAGTSVIPVQLGERPLDRECSPRCAFSVVFLRHRIAEQRHDPVTQFFGDVATHLRHCCRGGVEIRADQIAPVFRIKPRRDAGRTRKITEHHRDMSALANGFCNRRGRWRLSRWSCGVPR